MNSAETFWNLTKSKTYKILLNVLLRVPDVFYSALFAVAFPIYKALHTKRAYGRTVRHLENAKAYLKTTVSARDMFKGIFWNALDSYR